MQPLAVAVATTAGTILVYPRVVALIFRLSCLAIHLDVVNLHIRIATVVIELHGNITAGICAVRIILHAGSQGPVRDNIIVDQQINVLRASGAPRTDHNRVAAGT